MIHKSDSSIAKSWIANAKSILERLIRGGITTHKTVGIKTGNAGMAYAIDHAAWHDLSVAPGRLCEYAVRPKHSLQEDRRRWSIETMFAHLKTKGFNLEDTHITDRDKLSTLLAVLALSLAFAVKTGFAAARLRAIPIKNHGRKAWSLFGLGLSCLRKIFAAASFDQVFLFLRQLLSPKLPLKPLQSMVL